ncbi:GntR family transcriptional regulator [Spirochaetota bacterium]
MTDIQIDKEDPNRSPLYIQIMNRILDKIRSGDLKAGDKLPSINYLSKILDVNVNTAAKAYRYLELSGVIIKERGKGAFVA